MAVTLALDIGNSALKWAVVETGQVRESGASVHRELGIAAALRTIPPAHREMSRVALVNVAGRDAAQTVEQWLGRAPYSVRATSAAAGVRNAYPQPDMLGADRWAALIAAHQRAAQPTVVVSCGTAVTLDAINAAGLHLGGHIIPGLDAMRTALAGATNAVRVPAREVEPGFGRDTPAAVATGSRRAIAGLVEAAVGELEAGAEPRWHILLTGGDAERCRPWFTRPVEIEPHLVLLGAAALLDDANL